MQLSIHWAASEHRDSLPPCPMLSSLCPCTLSQIKIDILNSSAVPCLLNGISARTTSQKQSRVHRRSHSSYLLPNQSPSTRLPRTSQHRPNSQWSLKSEEIEPLKIELHFILDASNAQRASPRQPDIQQQGDSNYLYTFSVMSSLLMNSSNFSLL